MKIISKYKDYYDYLQGVYGVDEKIVYERIDGKNSLHKPMFMPNTLETFFFAICGYIYVVNVYNGKFYFGRDVKMLMKVKYEGTTYESWYFKKDHYDKKPAVDKHMTKTKINDKEGVPICMITNYMGSADIADRLIRLSDFGFQQIISPHDMYITISNWLSREKPVTDKRTDLQKIVGHGFDKKKSFRNM